MNKLIRAAFTDRSRRFNGLPAACLRSTDVDGPAFASIKELAPHRIVIRKIIPCSRYRLACNDRGEVQVTQELHGYLRRKLRNDVWK